MERTGKYRLKPMSFKFNLDLHNYLDLHNLLTLCAHRLNSHIWGKFHKNASKDIRYIEQTQKRKGRTFWADKGHCNTANNPPSALPWENNRLFKHDGEKWSQKPWQFFIILWQANKLSATQIKYSLTYKCYNDYSGLPVNRIDNNVYF